MIYQINIRIIKDIVSRYRGKILLGGIEMALIHKFKQGDNFFVLDVNTGAVHIVDELVYDLVDDNKLRDKEELIKEFGAKYG